MKNKIYVTDLDDNISIIERPYSFGGQDFNEVYARDRKRDKTEYIGTAYDEMEFYYNENYIVFSKDLEAEFVFDLKNWRFIDDAFDKAMAFRNVLKDSLLEVLENEKEAIKNDARRNIIGALTRRHKTE